MKPPHSCENHFPSFYIVRDTTLQDIWPQPLEAMMLTKMVLSCFVRQLQFQEIFHENDIAGVSGHAYPIERILMIEEAS